MSEKKYLLTESDISKIGQLECDICDTNAMGRFDCSEALDAEMHRMLESHEYRERTCQMLNDDWEDSFGEYKHLYECGICSESTALLSCINENGDTEWVKPKFCGYCGARVVSE